MDYQADAIDRVIKNAIKVMEDSKYQMFEILEASRQELVSLNQELKRTLKETTETLEKVDQLELNY
ncbi:hypothetical protein, partial [Streptomyces sp. URMC 124]